MILSLLPFVSVFIIFGFCILLFCLYYLSFLSLLYFVFVFCYLMILSLLPFVSVYPLLSSSAFLFSSSQMFQQGQDNFANFL